MSNSKLKTVDNITDEFNNHFGPRVINLVLFGSLLRDNDGGDVDLHLLLDEKSEDDLVIIASILEKQKDKVDLIISYKKDISKDKYMRIRTQGSYFLYSLAYGKILLGNHNYYLELLNRYDQSKIKKDLILKNSEYENVMRDFLLEEDILNKQQKLAKYFIRYLTQTLVIDSKLNYEEILSVNKQQLLKKVSSFLIQNDADTLRRLFKGEESNKNQLINKCTKLLFNIDKINHQLIKYYG